MASLLNLMYREKNFLGLLFCISFLIRLGFYHIFLQNNPLMFSFDSGHYQTIALQLIQGFGFAGADGLPQFYRLPGYPLFLAFCYKIFGVKPFIVFFLQIILASLIPILLFLLVTLCLPRHSWIARASGLIAACHVGFAIFAGLIMTEILFTLFFLIAVILLIQSMLFTKEIHATSSVLARKMFMSGVLFGCATLIRPVGIMLVLCALFVVLLKRRPVQQKVAMMIWLSIGWIILVMPWLMRNLMLTGSLFFSTLSGPHLLNHGAVRIIMDVNQCSWQQAHDIVCAAKNDSFNPETYTANLFFTHPLATAKLFASNMFKTIFSLYSSELLFIDSGGQLPAYDINRSMSDMIRRFLVPNVKNKWIIGVIYYETVMHILILIGLCGYLITAFLKGRPFLPVCAVLIFCCLFLLLSSICGYARLRLPIEPFFIMLAVMFWRQVQGKRG